MRYLYLIPVFFLSATHAFAGVSCTGIVNRVIIAPEGDIYVDFGQNGNARLKICQMGGSMAVDRGIYGGAGYVNSANCQAMLASFTTAMASGKTVKANVDRTDCAFVDGAIPAPYPYQFEFSK